jgi:phage N-6-adenine-methyltransferase
MSVVGYKARNHPQQVALRGADFEVDDRTTTREMFDPLDARFEFTIDVAASAINARCLRYYTIEDDGLKQSWAGESVWCNPPYSDIRPWVEKAWAEDGRARSVVLLLPANRTEQGWWQDLVEPYRDHGTSLHVEFLRGRQRFIAAGRRHVGANERPPFGLALLIWAPMRPVLP